MNLREVSVELNAVVSDPDEFFNTVQDIHPNSAGGFTVGSVYHYDFKDNFDMTGSISLFRWEGDYLYNN